MEFNIKYPNLIEQAYNQLKKEGPRCLLRIHRKMGDADWFHNRSASTRHRGREPRPSGRVHRHGWQ